MSSQTDESRAVDKQEEHSPFIKALEWIGLDLKGPDKSSILQIVIYAMLVFVPAAFAAKLLGLSNLWLFFTSVPAIIPLAKILSHATEQLALRVGAGIGGLLSATFGNAVEMIIAFFALQAGLFDVVKSSIAGSIIGNVLFVLGLSFYLGGLGREEQTFNKKAAGISATQLTLAAMALVIPAAFVLTSPPNALSGELQEELSIGVSIILLVAYAAQMVFFLRTHKHLYAGEDDEAPEHAWSIKHSAGVLIGATVLVAIVADILVQGLEYLTETVGLSELFVGVIVVALVGSAAENVTAVIAALKDRVELSVNIVTGSSLQIALFVAPVLVLLGFFIGRPLDLFFNPFEVVAIFVTMLIVNAIIEDGRSNWFEGVQLLAGYAILAVAFFFHP